MNAQSTRRTLFAATAAAGASAIAAPAVAQTRQPQVRWRLVSSFPKSLDTIYAGATDVAERVAAATNGAFQIQVFAAGEIVPAFGVLDAVQGGTVECGHTVMTYFTGKDYAFAFDAGLPFGMNARQQNAWFYYGGGQELLREFMAGYNILTIPAGNTAGQMGGWFRREVKTSEDLRGLKMRVTGAAGQVLSRLGLIPQQIAGGDVYPSLERGTIDAAEWIGPYDDEKLGFQKVAKYYYYPGWWDVSGQVSMFINLKAWEALPADYRALVETACGDANVRMLAKYDARNPPALRRLVAAGAELRVFPNEMTAACYKEAHAFYEETATTNPAFRKIYTAWKAFRDDQVLWWRIGEMPMDAVKATLANRG